MITLDLRNLTQAHVDEAMPNMGACTYSSPCIIGTLIPEELRGGLDIVPEDNHGVEPVAQLIGRGLILFLNEDQCRAAQKIQTAFDSKERDLFQELVQPWVNS